MGSYKREVFYLFQPHNAFVHSRTGEQKCASNISQVKCIFGTYTCENVKIFYDGTYRCGGLGIKRVSKGVKY